MEQGNILSMKFEKGKKESTITVSYFVPETNRNRTEEITEPPHQDFFTALLSLSKYLGKVFYVEEDKLPLYSATGFKYTSNEKVIITGKMSTASGSVVGIATPAINTDDEVYGFEEEFSENLSKLVFETYQLLLGKKVGVKQLTIDDAIEDNKNTSSEESEEENLPPDNNEFTLPE